MSITLISSTDIREMLGNLEVVQLGGIAYVDARELADAVNKLCRGLGSLPVNAPAEVRQVLEQAVAPADPVAMVQEAVTEATNVFEAERARLAALPPGPCGACTCATKIAHPGGRCVECDCEPYIDSTERDPVVTLAARGIASAPDAEIAPAVSMFDTASIGLDLRRAPMSERYTDG